MKFPNHIILDWNSLNATHSSKYWFLRYLSIDEKRATPFYFSIHKKFTKKKKNLALSAFFKNQKQYTLKYNYTNPSLFFSKNKNVYIENFFNDNTKLKYFDNYAVSSYKKINIYLKNQNPLFNEKVVKRLYKIFALKNAPLCVKTDSLWNLFDINFLRKEKIYTKLKYSRVPQYDIVSGGVAALFAGFLGFLICEKFGFELLDSGDFYTFVMYIVFFCFFCRLFLKLFTTQHSSWSGFSLKWSFLFYKNLFLLVLCFLNLFSSRK